MVGSVTKKIALGLRCIASILIVSLCGTIGWYVVRKTGTMHGIKKRLTEITMQRSQAIQKFMDMQEKNLCAIFQHPDIVTIIQEIEQPGFLALSADASRLKYQQFDALLKSHYNRLNYKNLVICSPQGQVIFSDIPAYARQTIADKPLATSAVGQSLTRALMTLTTDFSDFSYDNALQKPALFITTPLFIDKRLAFIVSMRIDENNLYDITDNYIGLGATGEIIISKIVKKGALFINKCRNEALAPFKKFIPMTTMTKGEHLSPTQEAPLGNQGAGITFDYRHILSYASWQFVPQVDWGIVAKIDLKELLLPLAIFKKSLWILAIALLITLLFMLHYDKSFTQRLHAWYSQKKLSNALLLGWVIALITTGTSVYYLQKVKSAESAAMHTLVQTKMKHAREDIQEVLRSVELLTQTIAYDLSLKDMPEDALENLFKQAIANNNAVAGISVAYAPFQYTKDQKLFARYLTRNAHGEITTHKLDELYDYTASEKKSHFRVFYVDAFEKAGLVWLDPRFEELGKMFVVPCSLEFFGKDKKLGPKGVVTIFLDMNVIKKIAESVTISSTSYTYIMSKSGDFIYHPQQKYIENNVTMKDLAETMASPELVTISKKSQDGGKGFYSFINPKTQEITDVYFMPLPTPQWSFGVFFPRADSLPPLQVLRRNYILILFACIALLIFSLALMLRIDEKQRQTAIRIFSVLTIPFILCQGCLLYIAYNNSAPEHATKIIATDTVGLQRFIREQQEIAEIVHEKPYLPLTTGIEIDSIEFPLEEGAKISGFIWQKYDHIAHQGLEKAVLFSQANKMVDLVKKYEIVKDNATVIGWKFYLQMPVEFNYSKYPLDTNQISIHLEHPDIGKNILLVPDFSDYQDITPSALPGIEKNFSLNGFNVNSSQFTFSLLPQNTTYGVEPFGQAISYLVMNFDITITRDIIYAILVFFLPIFVIMFAIYAIFFIYESGGLDIYKALAAYTGMLLTIIFLHRMLRDRHVTGTILYIEYFFFLTYITLLILILHLLLRRTSIYSQPWYRAMFSFYKVFFWDVIMAVSIFITVMIFY